MAHIRRTSRPWRAAQVWRAGSTIAAIVVVQTAVCGMSVLPVLLLWLWLVPPVASLGLAGVAAVSFAVLPSYALFALCLMLFSPAASRLTGARTPADAEMRLAEMGWPLMRWVQYMAATHVVRVLAGSLFRGTPIWSWYLRLNGAHVGRRVYVNTLSISDHNLLHFADDVVIGGDVHLSGHTVEGGVVKTGRVCLAEGVTIGIGAIVDINVTAGPRCKVGALSFVPKHSVLEGDATYAGIPVRRIDRIAAPTAQLPEENVPSGAPLR